MSWFGFGGGNNNSGQHEHSHNGQPCQAHGHGVNQNLQHALAQGFQPMPAITPAEMRKMQDDGLTKEQIMEKIKEKGAAMKQKAIEEGMFIEAPKFTEAKDGYAFQMGPFGIGYYKQVTPTPEQLKMMQVFPICIMK